MQPFSPDEAARLTGIFAGVRAALEVFLQGDVSKAMSVFNRRDVPIDELARARGADPAPEASSTAHGSP